MFPCNAMPLLKKTTDKIHNVVNFDIVLSVAANIRDVDLVNKTKRFARPTQTTFSTDKLPIPPLELKLNLRFSKLWLNKKKLKTSVLCDLGKYLMTCGMKSSIMPGFSARLYFV